MTDFLRGFFANLSSWSSKENSSTPDQIAQVQPPVQEVPLVSVHQPVQEVPLVSVHQPVQEVPLVSVHQPVQESSLVSVQPPVQTALVSAQPLPGANTFQLTFYYKVAFACAVGGMGSYVVYRLWRKYVKPAPEE